MSDFVIDTDEVQFVDKKGNLLVKGSLIDLSYATAMIMADDKSKSREEQGNILATMFVDKFQPKQASGVIDISWGTALKISIKVNEALEKEKKS